MGIIGVGVFITSRMQNQRETIMENQPQTGFREELSIGAYREESLWEVNEFCRSLLVGSVLGPIPQPVPCAVGRVLVYSPP